MAGLDFRVGAPGAIPSIKLRADNMAEMRENGGYNGPYNDGL